MPIQLLYLNFIPHCRFTVGRGLSHWAITNKISAPFVVHLSGCKFKLTQKSCKWSENPSIWHDTKLCSNLKLHKFKLRKSQIQEIKKNLEFRFFSSNLTSLIYQNATQGMWRFYQILNWVAEYANPLEKHTPCEIIEENHSQVIYGFQIELVFWQLK